MERILGTANMLSEITNKSAFKYLTVENQCVRNRRVCNKQCSSCPYYVDPAKMDSVFKFVLDILRARDPELNFLNELQKLEILTENAKENENKD